MLENVSSSMIPLLYMIVVVYSMECVRAVAFRDLISGYTKSKPRVLGKCALEVRATALINGSEMVRLDQYLTSVKLKEIVCYS
jgi:hypothetical protein